jgi:hypothetical protein
MRLAGLREFGKRSGEKRGRENRKLIKNKAPKIIVMPGGVLQHQKSGIEPFAQLAALTSSTTLLESVEFRFSLYRYRYSSEIESRTALIQ